MRQIVEQPTGPVEGVIDSNVWSICLAQMIHMPP
jgi:hypothetical protein